MNGNNDTELFYNLGRIGLTAFSLSWQIFFERSHFHKVIETLLSPIINAGTGSSLYYY